MSVLGHLEPKKVFEFFEGLSQVPRGTFDTDKISDYCVAFAKERGLEYIQDEVGNVIIKKPGTEGYEASEPIILQGHLDMVCEKHPDSPHDFKKDGLELRVEDGFVKANQTTLGADNGIAVAMTMAILDSTDIPHPPIEALFTIDEEIGMGGAHAVDLYQLKGNKLINIDSEEEGILTAGCAGGIQYETITPFDKEEKEGVLVTIRIHGLAGGHSGIEIHTQRGNGHKMMARLLRHLALEETYQLCSFEGGSKDNVISRDTTAKLLVKDLETANKVVDVTNKMKEIWDHEFMGEEPGLVVDTAVEEGQFSVMTADSTKRIVQLLLTLPNGLIEYSRKIAGIVETSLNIGVVETREDSLRTGHLLRSSVESRKTQLKEEMDLCAEAAGGTGHAISEYPAWQYNLNSELRDRMVSTYKELYGEEPEVSIVHAGLECGLFLGKRGDLDCVSFGPSMFEVHSYNERLSIESTQRTFEYLKAILKNSK